MKLYAELRNVRWAEANCGMEAWFYGLIYEPATGNWCYVTERFHGDCQSIRGHFVQAIDWNGKEIGAQWDAWIDTFGPGTHD